MIAETAVAVVLAEPEAKADGYTLTIYSEQNAATLI